MKKNLFTMAAAAMMAAATLPEEYNTELRLSPAKTKEKSSAEKKKCKSCKHITYGKSKYSCWCSYERCIDPMRCACGHYEKRKKK